MRVGLVLEGGGMCGLYSAGVLDVFLDAGIDVSVISAVSAGALFGVNYVSGQKGRALRYNLQFLGDPRYMSWRSWFTTGNVVNKQFAFYEVPFVHDVFDQEAFAQRGIDFYAALTNMRTGRAEHWRITDVLAQMEVLRATSALPFVSRPVWLNGQPYLDGGVSDSIPLAHCQSLAPTHTIVVLTQPIGYRKTERASRSAALYYWRYPQFAQRLTQRNTQYNEQLAYVAQQEQQQKIFVVRPSEPLQLGRLETNPEVVQQVYQLGVRDMQQRLSELMRYLSGTPLVR